MSLVNTRLNSLRANSKLDKNELRPSRYGVLDLFMQQSDDPTGIISEELKAKALASIGNTLQVPVIDYDADVTISNIRSVTIPDDENTSQLVTVTFATYAWGFTIVPAQYMNNEIAMQRDFDTKMNKYIYKFGETLDSVGASTLAAAKTQVFGDTLNYTVTGNVVQVPWKLRNNILGNIGAMMAANDHYMDISIAGNAGIEALVGELAQKSIYNSENKTLEYNDKTFHYSNRIPNASGKYATFFAVQSGSVGLVTRFEREVELNTKMADGTAWSKDVLPMLNFPIGTYFYESKGDYSSIGGAATSDMTRVRKEHYGFAVDVAFLTVYNSSPSTIASPIMQFVINDEAPSDYPYVTIANTPSNPVPTEEVV